MRACVTGEARLRAAAESSSRLASRVSESSRGFDDAFVRVIALTIALTPLRVAVKAADAAYGSDLIRRNGSLLGRGYPRYGET